MLSLKSRRKKPFPAMAHAAILLFLFSGLCPAGFAAEREEQRPPNVVLIFVDDMGYADAGVYGAPKIRTPRIDELAHGGAMFTSLYAESLCSPSRAALLTGSYAQRTGVERVFWPDSEDGLHPGEITIAKLLQENGYATACIGKWHLGHEPEFLPTSHGFDSYFGMPYSNDMGPDSRREAFDPLPIYRNEEVIERGPDQRYLTKRYTEEALEFLDENQNQPFFLYLAHTFPHVPLFIRDEFKGRSEFGIYGDVIEELDWSTGEILDRLNDLGLTRDTLVIFASDNGPWLQKGAHGGLATPFREGKGTAWEGGHRVPAIMRLPERIPAGTKVTELTTLMDLYPTIAQVAGAKIPDDRVIDGHGLWPLLTGEGEFEGYEAYYYYRLGRLRAVRSGDWKLHLEGEYRDYNNIYYDYTPEFSVQVHESLYNLAEDPGEQRNLALDHPEIVEQLKQKIQSHKQDLRKNSRPIGHISELRNQDEPDAPND